MGREKDRILILAKRDEINGAIQPLLLDKLCDSLQTINTPHAQIHDEVSFYCYQNITLDNTEVRDVLIVVPNKRGHLVYTLHGNKKTNLKMYVDTIVSANGTSIAIHNRDFNSIVTPSITAFHTPTITNVGTEKYNETFGTLGTNFLSDIGGIAEERDERILKENSNHLIRISSYDDTNDIFLKLGWYELES